MRSEDMLIPKRIVFFGTFLFSPPIFILLSILEINTIFVEKEGKLITGQTSA
jgi:hypothetical protein